MDAMTKTTRVLAGTLAQCSAPRWYFGARPRRLYRRRSWVLLETVIATGLLIVGLAVIGTQVQQADTSIRKMRQRLRAMTLAEMQLARLDMGLVELDTVDEVQEEDFGPRYPDFGWRLTIEETGHEEMFLLKLDVLYLLREGEYEPDEFEHDDAEAIHTVYALRPAPRPLNLAEDFGLDEEEAIALGEKLDVLGIEGLSVEALNPTILATLNFEEFLEVVPLIADVLGIDVGEMAASLPPEIREVIEKSGVLDDGGAEGDEAAEDEGG